jgi:hypothetical protein
MPTWLMPKSLSSYAIIGLVVFSSAMSMLYFFEKSSHKATAQEYALFKTKTQALGEIAKAKKIEEEARQELVNNTIVNSYDDSIQQLKDYYAKNPNIKYIRVVDSLPNNGSRCSGMPEKTASPASIETENAGVAEITATGVETEIYDNINAKRLNFEIVQCLELVNWVNQQGF